MIQINNVSKNYGAAEALKNLSISVNDGSIFGLVGKNGSGKSTLLRVMSGVFKADGGEVLFDGENIYENERKKREVFFLPDDPFYNANINGEKLAQMYKAFYNFDEEIFKKYIGIYGLSLKKPLKNFSKGMKRQMFVCIAFAVKPKFLLLDEVFDGLDPFARRTFKSGLIELNEATGCTCVIASHSLRELEDICDSFALIENKTLLRSGSLSDCLENTFKFQIAFSEPVKKEDFPLNCLYADVSGRIAKIIVRGEKEEILRVIESMCPILVDELPVNFEEYFIGEIRGTEER